MQERNVLSGALAAVFSPFVSGWESIIAWLIVAAVLVFVDLRFGIRAAKRRGERVRVSRAARRTINKLVDYICWISVAWVLGGSFGKVFDIPLLAAVIMLVVYAVEVSSIFDNFFEARGINKKFNALKFLSKIFRISTLEESIEDKPIEDKKNQEGGNGANNTAGAAPCSLKNKL